MTEPTVRSDMRVQTLLDCAAWHEQQVAEMHRKIAKAEDWSAENNDGRRELGGTLFTEDMPRYIDTHTKAARHFRRLANKAKRAR